MWMWRWPVHDGSLLSELLGRLRSRDDGYARDELIAVVEATHRQRHACPLTVDVDACRALDALEEKLKEGSR